MTKVHDLLKITSKWKFQHFTTTFNKSGLSLKKNKIKLSELNIKGKITAHFPSFRTITFVSCDTCIRQYIKVIPAFLIHIFGIQLCTEFEKKTDNYHLVFSLLILLVQCIQMIPKSSVYKYCSTYFSNFRHYKHFLHMKYKVVGLLPFFFFFLFFLKKSSSFKFNRKKRGSKC